MKTLVNGMVIASALLFLMLTATSYLRSHDANRRAYAGIVVAATIRPGR